MFGDSECTKRLCGGCVDVDPQSPRGVIDKASIVKKVKAGHYRGGRGDKALLVAGLGQ